MSITKLNESSLLAAGLDRPTVKALTHLLRQVGSEVNAETLPEVAAQAGTTAATLQSIATDLANAIESLSLLSTLPNAELVPAPDDLTPVAQMTVAVEFLQTEVRQIAEQQVVLMNLINELRQGTML